MPRLIPIETPGGSTPHHYPVNKIITRGFGPMRDGVPGRAGPVTQGYGGPPPGFVVTAFRQLVFGQSGTKRRLAQLDEVIVWAKLIEYNGKVPERPIKGWIRVRVSKQSGFASVMAESVRVIRDYIKVTVSRLK